MPDNQPSAEQILRDLLVDHPHEVVATAMATRGAVLNAASGSSELISKHYAVIDVFTLTGALGQAFCHMAIYAKHVNLGFNRGTELPDPTGLLAGTGKMIRHVRVPGPTFSDNEDFRNLIADAVTQGYEMADLKGGVQPRRIGFRPKP